MEAENKIDPPPTQRQELLVTQFLAEANFIATVTGQKPVNVTKGPLLLKDGVTPVTRWWFVSTPAIDEAIAFYRAVDTPKGGNPKDWSMMTKDEKHAVAKICSYLAANQRLFLRHVKETSNA